MANRKTRITAVKAIAMYFAEIGKVPTLREFLQDLQ